jgi:hypothetical protein
MPLLSAAMISALLLSLLEPVRLIVAWISFCPLKETTAFFFIKILFFFYCVYSGISLKVFNGKIRCS